MPKERVVVYTSQQEGSDSYDQRWIDNYGITVIRDRTKILLPTPRVISQLRKIILTERIETIWFGAAAPLALSSRWLRSSGVKRIVALTHGHEVWWSKVPPFTFLMREMGRSVDAIGYLGEFTRRALERTVPKEKLVQIAPGIDVDHFTPGASEDLKRALNLENKRVIVSVGRLVHRKGQDRLIEALPKILTRFPESALLMIGQGPYRDHLVQLASKLGVSEHVHFIGRISYEELPQYLRVGELFAMPSRTRFFGLEVEGLGIVYLEASAAGLPVIAGDSGGAPDAVIQGETGFVVPGNDVEAIADRCIEILENSSLRVSMGKSGRQFAMEIWRWEKWSEQFNSLVFGEE